VQARVNLHNHYDVAVIGGGVHGAAMAWEASLTGANVCLLERDDFGAETSANSLKIIHGGLRYLQHLDVVRTREYAAEQARLMSWFPHLVTPLQCVMPTYSDWRRGRTAMRIGIALYGLLSGPRCLPRGAVWSKHLASERIEGGWQEDMTGAATWYDAQVYNSERLVLSYALSARSQGADIYNHMEVTNASNRLDRVELELTDRLDNSTYGLTASYVIDAAGGTGEVIPQSVPQAYSRAVNLVFSGSGFEMAQGLRLPGSDQFGGGRLLFLVPWRGTTMTGTWYFPDRKQAVISRNELEACLDDLQMAAPELHWSETNLSMVHVGRLPLTVSGDRLLEKPVVSIDPDRPRVTRVIGVKYSNARLLAQKVVTGLFGAKALAERKCYGAEFTDWQAFKSSAQNRWASELGDSTVTRLLANYGSNLDPVMAVGPSGGLKARVADSDLLVDEIAFVCQNEHAFTVADVLRRTGMGDRAKPEPALIEVCAHALAQRYGWDTQKISGEIVDVSKRYQRVVDG